MLFYFYASCFVCCTVAARQNTKTEDEYIVFSKVENESGPDIKSWNAHLKKFTRLSAAGGIPPGACKITVRFIVDKDGNLADVKASNNPGHRLAKKAENIVLHYEGVWRPASQCGRTDKSYKEQVIQFVVTE